MDDRMYKVGDQFITARDGILTVTKIFEDGTVGVDSTDSLRVTKEFLNNWAKERK